MPFPVLLADPPWRFRDGGSRMAPHYAGRGRHRARYRVLPLAEILAAGPLVQTLICTDAFLFLWAPNALVLDGTAQAVCTAWGFVPKQLVPWLKTSATGQPRLGGGHYTRVCTEQLVVARRGRAQVARRDIPGFLAAPRRAHSAKPDASYLLIERLCAGPYLELYARRRFSPLWTAWGDQL